MPKGRPRLVHEPTCAVITSRYAKTPACTCGAAERAKTLRQSLKRTGGSNAAGLSSGAVEIGYGSGCYRSFPLRGQS